MTQSFSIQSMKLSSLLCTFQSKFLLNFIKFHKFNIPGPDYFFYFFFLPFHVHSNCPVVMSLSVNFTLPPSLQSPFSVTAGLCCVR